MQTGQVIAFVTVVAIIALALGTTIGYSLSSGKPTTSLAPRTQTITSYATPQTLTTVTTQTQTVLSYASLKGITAVTKLIIISYVESLAAYTSGTCSWVAGTAYVNSSVSTEYIFPSNINDTSQQQFLNITITTVTSNLTNLTSSTTTTITLSAASQNTSTTCPFGV
jgi:hypothetical protein